MKNLWPKITESLPLTYEDDCRGLNPCKLKNCPDELLSLADKLGGE